MQGMPFRCKIGGNRSFVLVFTACSYQLKSRLLGVYDDRFLHNLTTLKLKLRMHLWVEKFKRSDNELIFDFFEKLRSKGNEVC